MDFPAKQLMVTILIIFSLIVLSVPAGSEDYYDLTAEDINYDYDNDRVYARGEVVFSAPDIRVRAEQLVVKVDEHIVNAEGGPVLFKTPEQEISGEYLEYDYRAGTGKFYGARTDIDQLYFSGGVIEIIKGKDYSLQIEEAGLTPCILPEPHYQIRADRVRVYPDERVVGSNVQFWWKDSRLFSLPFYVVKYKEMDDGGLRLIDSTPIPHLGYNSRDGLSLELDYSYEIGDRSRGEIYLKGAHSGEGEIEISNSYNFSQDLTLRSNYTYDRLITDQGQREIEENLVADLIYQINPDLDWENKLSFNREGIVENLETTGQYRSRLSHRIDKSQKISAGYNYQQDLDDPADNESKIFTDWQYKKAGLQVKTGIDYNLETAEREEELTLAYRPGNDSRFKTSHYFIDEELEKYSYIFSNNAGKINWQVNYRHGYDLDYRPNFKFTLPEYYNIKSGIEIGHLQEGEEKSLDKIKLNLDYDQTLKLNDNINLELVANYISNIYNPLRSDIYSGFRIRADLDYRARLADKLMVKGKVGRDKRLTSGQYLLEDDEIEEKDVVNSVLEIRLQTPEPRSAWVLENNMSYLVQDEEWEEVGLNIRREFDCYSLEMGYEFSEQVFTFGFNL